MAVEQPALPDAQVKQVVHGDHNIVVGTGNITINNLRSAPSSLERRPLDVLLERVEQFWVKGVLQGSAHGEVLLELNKESVNGLIEHPWEKILEVPGQAGRTLPAERGIGEIFEEVGRFLLILGEPGAGKTTTLLELARALIARARSDESQPIPVVFNLSTWGVEKKSLADWLVDELKGKYFVSRRIAESWLGQSLLLPLLDGLDEVENESQGACVEAINAFVHGNGPPGLAVCCRSVEYLRLGVRLSLNGAVRLLPLTADQVAGYFQNAGPRLAALEAALRGDPGLQELARSPLMLSVMVLTYQDVPLAALADDQRRSAADVFSTYIDRMFERRGRGRQLYSKEATVAWLSHLAQGLQRENQSVFLIEQLQPTWLRSHTERWSYVLASRLLVGTAMGMGGALIAFWTPGLLLCGMLQGLGAGLVDGARFAWSRRGGPMSRIGWFLAQMAVIASIAAFLSSQPIWPRGSAIPWMYAPIWGTLFGLRAQREMPQDIRTVETLRWSWRWAWKMGLVGFVVGGSVGWLFLSAFDALGAALGNGHAKPWNDVSLIVGGLSWGLCGALSGAIYGGLSYGILKSKAKPNQGIMLSARNSSLAGLGVGLLVGIFGFFPQVEDLFVQGFHFGLDVRLSLLLGLFGGLTAGLWFGGMDVLQHIVLRLLIWRSGDAPLNYPRFLDHAAKLILLQKVGGGYIFMHRLLLEHFAALVEGDGG